MSLIVKISILALLTSCAAMKKDWEDTYCNYEGAYQHGLNEALENKEMDNYSLQSCPAKTKESALKGYRNGFTKGLSSRAKKIELDINNGSKDN